MKQQFLKSVLPVLLLVGAVFIIGSGCSFGDTIGYDFYYEDIDGDGFGAGNSINVEDNTPPPAGYVGSNTDCDDSNPDIYPGAIEIADNALDEDCNGLFAFKFYKDGDEDGFGDTNFSEVFEINIGDGAPDGYVSNKADCDDTNPEINPLANEVFGNNIDDNCNGEVDTDDKFIDADGDGYGSTEITPADGVYNSLDCDDNNAAIHSYAEEVVNDIDDDCDGQVDELY